MNPTLAQNDAEVQFAHTYVVITETGGWMLTKVTATCQVTWEAFSS